MLDPERLKAELAAKADRMKGPLWAGVADGTAQNWSSMMTTAPQHTDAEPVAQSPLEHLTPQERRKESPQPAVAYPAMAFDAATAHRLRADPDASPDWLQAVAGNPLTYDAPESRRVNVCARLLPSTYASVKKAKNKLGLRTIAGTWEYIIRLGLAVAGRG